MSDMYFGPDVDQAIALYQIELDKKKRDKIFEEEIKPAFEKLITYHYYRMPVSKNPEIMGDCLSYLTEQISKFDSSHKRGFPYFNVITRNFFIQKLNFQRKTISSDGEKNVTTHADVEPQRKGMDLQIAENFELEVEKKEFFEILRNNLPKWKSQFQKPQEKIFIDALITLIDNMDNIHVYNKKACFFYLRELTGLNAKQIAANLNKIKKKFDFLKKRYQKGDI